MDMSKIIALMMAIACSFVSCNSVAHSQKSQDQSVKVSTAKPAAPDSSIIPKSELVSGPGFQGAVFPADTDTPPDLQLYPASATFWTPTKGDVGAMEQNLPAFLKHSRNPRAGEVLKQLASYKRQYRGVVLRGRKQIFVRFFCEISSDSWMREETVVLMEGVASSVSVSLPERRRFRNFGSTERREFAAIPD